MSDFSEDERQIHSADEDAEIAETPAAPAAAAAAAEAAAAAPDVMKRLSFPGEVPEQESRSRVRSRVRSRMRGETKEERKEREEREEREERQKDRDHNTRRRARHTRKTHQDGYAQNAHQQGHRGSSVFDQLEPPTRPEPTDDKFLDELKYHTEVLLGIHNVNVLTQHNAHKLLCEVREMRERNNQQDYELRRLREKIRELERQLRDDNERRKQETMAQQGVMCANPQMYNPYMMQPNQPMPYHQ